LRGHSSHRKVEPMPPKTAERLTFQPPHPLNQQEKQYLASVSQNEKDLFELASKMLGSSHFTGKTHGYTDWMKKNKTNK
jgi:hypothetical protein